MPMGAPDPDVWLTYNGDVYKGGPLRAELECLSKPVESVGPLTCDEQAIRQCRTVEGHRTTPAARARNLCR